MLKGFGIPDPIGTDPTEIDQPVCRRACRIPGMEPVEVRHGHFIVEGMMECPPVIGEVELGDRFDRFLQKGGILDGMLDHEVIHACDRFMPAFAEDSPQSLDSLPLFAGRRKHDADIGGRHIQSFVEGFARDQNSCFAALIAPEGQCVLIGSQFTVVEHRLARILLLQAFIQEFALVDPLGEHQDPACLGQQGDEVERRIDPLVGGVDQVSAAQQKVRQPFCQRIVPVYQGLERGVEFGFAQPGEGGVLSKKGPHGLEDLQTQGFILSCLLRIQAEADVEDRHPVDHLMGDRLGEGVGVDQGTHVVPQRFHLRGGRKPETVVVVFLLGRKGIEKGEDFAVFSAGVVVALVGDEEDRFVRHQMAVEGKGKTAACRVHDIEHHLVCMPVLKAAADQPDLFAPDGKLGEDGVLPLVE